MTYAKCGCPDFPGTYQGVCWNRCKVLRKRRQLQQRVRWTRIVAIGLGVLLALWLLRGDARPEAAESHITLTVSRISLVNGVAYYRLLGGDNGAAVLSVDTDVEIAKYLATHRQVTLNAR